MVKLVMYNESYWSLCRIPDKVLYRDEFKRKKRKKIKSDWLENITDKEEIERISLSRSKNHIKDICLSNHFEYFATFTVDSKNADRFSLEECQIKMKKICNSIKKRNKDFKYIYITEKHKNSAFHFHGMVKNLDSFYINKNGYLSSTDFDKLGYNSFSKIKDYNACCNYITKYITKNCIKNTNNQIYFCSRGLSKGDYEYMIDYDLNDIFKYDNKIFNGQYCQKKDFDLNKLPKTSSRNLNAYFKINDEIMQNDNNYITNWLKLFTNKVNGVNIIT